MKCRIFFLVTFLICLSFHTYPQCRNITFEEGVKRKLVSEDLFSTSLNSEFMGCPKFSEGDSTLCGTIQNKKDNWDIGLPEGLLFSMFFVPSHYAICKDILNDPSLTQILEKVPEPNEPMLKWFNWRNTYHTVLFFSENKYPDTLDWFQRKIISVMYKVKSWTFCPETHYLSSYTVHGLFDENRNIVIYNTACKAGKIYDADIETIALAYRLFFVCAHEFCHAIDKESGMLSRENYEQIKASEHRANVNGLILTLGFSKLINHMLSEYQGVLKTAPNKFKCDEKYLKEVIKDWQKVDAYLRKLLKQTKLSSSTKSAIADSKINKDWNIWGCLEPR